MILGPEYTELRQLGSGASGSVVLVRHEPTGLLLAVKHLSKRLARDDAFLARFRREAETLRRLRHPGVAALYWYVEAGDEAALGMELVNGVTLRQMLDQGATSPEAALLVLRGSLLGLDHVHAAGIVHRDYKPDNVMVDGEGMSRLIDLGIAVPVGRSGVAGTPRYMAPEQWLGEGATPGTDVYAATAVFFECLTGRPPFGGRTARKLRAQHLSSPVAVEEVPEAVRGLVARGMAKEAAERYPTAGVFVTELEAVAASAYGSEWKERGAAALAAAALALAALFPLRGGGPASVGSTGLATATTELAPPLIEADGANRTGLLGWLMRARTKRGLLAAVAAVAALLIGGTVLGLNIAGGHPPRTGVGGAKTIHSAGSPPAPGVLTLVPPPQASPTTGTAGQSIAALSDTVTLRASGAAAPTGNVSFTLYSDVTCATAVPGVSGSGAISTLNATSTATYTTSWTPTLAGTYSWIASYGGDANNAGFTTLCGAGDEQIVVGKASPTLAARANPATGTAGQNIPTLRDTATFGATGAAAPTGAVRFTLYRDATCATEVPGVSGSAAISTGSGAATATFTTSWTPTLVATYHWIASYGGDPNNEGSTTACTASNEQIVVAGRASPAITARASPLAGTAGQNIPVLADTATFGATGAAAPTGSVGFTLYSDATCAAAVPGVGGSSAIGTAGGVATATYTTSWTPTLAATYQWVASYGGDANNNGFTTGCGDSNEQVVVARASPVITTRASPSAGTAGQKVSVLSDTATFGTTGAAAPTGSVSFTLYSDAGCSAATRPVSGGAHTRPLGGASGCGPTCTTAVLGVGGSGAIGTAAGVPTATYTTSWTPTLAGTYHWVASYGGDANNNGFTTGCGDSNEQVVVARASPVITTRASPSEGTAGQNMSVLTDTATFGTTGAAAPTGSVSFTLYSDAGCSAATRPVSGGARTRPLDGPSGCGPTCATGVLEGSAAIGTAAGVSTATYTTSWTPTLAGTYHWIARYFGDANNNGSTTGCGDANEQILVSPASPSITTQAHPATGTAGQLIESLSDTATFGATGAAAPTGAVSFALYNDATCGTEPLLSGSGAITTTGGVSTATYTTSWTPTLAATYHWVATYGGDANNNGFTTACCGANEQIVVGRASPSISTQAGPTTGIAGQTVKSLSDTATFGATGAAAPTGSVMFTLYSDATCATAVPGVTGIGTITNGAGSPTATYTTSWTPTVAGTYRWIARYRGDANNNGFTTTCGASNEQVVVAKASPTLTTVANPSSGFVGNTFQDTGTVAGGVSLDGTGTITFKLYGPGDTSCAGPVLDTETARGIAANGTTYSTTTGYTPAVAGTYNWTAAYSGDHNNNSSSSGCTSEPVSVQNIPT